MQYVSPIVEALRGGPRPVFWSATLLLTGLWFLVPALFYSSPPGDVPLTLAVGHAWRIGTVFGPPLPFWLAAAAFTLAGGSIVGVYLLSQVCVAVTLWALFALGRALVGAMHAVLAVLLTTGIFALAWPSVDFGANVLAMPLTVLALLHLWRALGENRDRYWPLVGLDLGLLLLTTYAGVILVVLMAGFILATARGRERLRTVDFWAAPIVMTIIAAPHIIWFTQSGLSVPPLAVSGRKALDLFGRYLASHAGLVLLAAMGGGLFARGRTEAPMVARRPVDPFGRRFALFFALALPLAAFAAGVLFGAPGTLGRPGPFVVLSGLLAIVAAGDVIRVHRQQLLGWAWAAVVMVPPLVAIAGLVVLPWTGSVGLRVAEPANAMGRFFTESFRRRTGKPLSFVIGEARLGGLVALASPDRPSLFIDAATALSPWIDPAEVREKGAVVVWALGDASGAPPPAIAARYPDLVAEVPRGFERAVQGHQPLFRVGWAVLRPAPPAQPAPSDAK